MKIYIAGPITGTDDARDRFEAMARRIERYGHTPINPFYIELAYPKGSHCEYMSLCFSLMKYADGILFMDGWKKSAGARMEYSRAKAARLPMYFAVEELAGKRL